MIAVRKIHGSLINYREEAIRPLRQLLADLAVQDRKKEKKDENGNLIYTYTCVCVAGKRPEAMADAASLPAEKSPNEKKTDLTKVLIDT